MTIINTTFALDPSLESEVLDWLRQHYIVAGQAAGLTSPRILKVTDQAEGADALSLAVQMEAADRALANRWVDSEMATHLKTAVERWPMRLMHYTTRLEVVE